MGFAYATVALEFSTSAGLGVDLLVTGLRVGVG